MSEKTFSVSSTFIVWGVGLIATAAFPFAPKLFSPAPFVVYALAIGSLLLALSRWGVRMGSVGKASYWALIAAYVSYAIAALAALAWGLDKLVDPAMGVRDTAYMGSLVTLVLAMWVSNLLPLVYAIVMAVEFFRE